MKKRFLFLLLMVVLCRIAPAQFIGLSLNPEIDAKTQFALRSYPLRTGFNYSGRLLLNVHLFYVMRLGAGIGFTSYTHPEKIDRANPFAPAKARTTWHNLCVPLKLTGCIPLRNQLMPMMEYESSLLIPQRINHVETFGSGKLKTPSPYNDRPFTENIVRVGALFRNDEKITEFAATFQLSFINDGRNGLHFVGVGLNLQFYWIFFSEGF